MGSLLRVFQTAALILFITTSTALAGTFGQTSQFFAQYGVGGPAETGFGVHNPSESVIIIEIELFNLMDGADGG